MGTEIQVDNINVYAELEEMGWDWEPGSDDEIKVKCPNPNHGDSSPSCSINVVKKMFKCHAASCGVHGDIITFIGLALKTTRRVVVEMLSSKYGGESTKSINADVIERYHQAIWSVPNMLKELAIRGIDAEIIREHRIGFDRGRITIPVYNEFNACVNVRRYMPGAPGADKMKNTRGHGSVRLYPIKQLSYDTLIVCGGETKALATARRMNPLNIGAITATAGEGNWEPHFTKLLTGKRVFVCMDIDDAGLKAGEQICARLRAETRWVGKLLLPLDRDQYPDGDLSHYWGPERKTPEDFLKLMDECQAWKPKALSTDDLVEQREIEDVHLADSTRAMHTGLKIRTSGVVTQKDETPYLVPKSVVCECDRNQTFCAICPVYATSLDADKGGTTLEIDPQSPGILQMIAAPKKSQREAVREALKIPPCKSVHFNAREFYNVEDVRLSPQLETAHRERDNVLQPLYYVGHGLETNAAYKFEGRVYPHPKDQRAVILASKAEPSVDSLSAFQPTDEELEELSVFKPAEWTIESIEQKLGQLYEDLSANVTRIFKRPDLHLAIDLVYHSALYFYFDNRLNKGWTECVIVGDSSQGKSETFIQLQKHYGLGERVVGKDLSEAGLLGGLVQSGTRWFITWGKIPQHDKRLVALEELKGAPASVLARITDTRSSGIAEIAKIEKRRTHARTRLLAISNPRSSKRMSEFNFGIEAIKELIDGLEDIRRFDFGVIVAASQIDPAEINVLMGSRPEVRHIHTCDLCRRLVLWAWTRLPEQITFTNEAIQSIMTSAVSLSTTYTDAVPLVDRGSIRFKLARLSIALAVRTFSCANEDPRMIVVRECHVSYITAYLDRLYSDPAFGYKDFSRGMKALDDLMDPDDIRARILQVPFVKDFVNAMLTTNDIEVRDIADWCGWEWDDAKPLMSFFVRKHALVRELGHYHKTSQFIELLKQMREDRGIVNRPDYLKDVDSTTRDM